MARSIPDESEVLALLEQAEAEIDKAAEYLQKVSELHSEAAKLEEVGPNLPLLVQVEVDWRFQQAYTFRKQAIRLRRHGEMIMRMYHRANRKVRKANGWT